MLFLLEKKIASRDFVERALTTTLREPRARLERRPSDPIRNYGFPSLGSVGPLYLFACETVTDSQDKAELRPSVRPSVRE